MNKTIRELAFLRDLYITSDWTERFTNLADEHLKLPKKGTFLYFNSGTGNHALALRERLKDDVEMTLVSENDELQKITHAKADAVKAKVDFQTPDEIAEKSFDTVFADAMLINSQAIEKFITEAISSVKPKGDILFFLPTAGSFGEIFSLLWEVLFNLDLAQRGAEVEKLITEIPSVSDVEEISERAGLRKIETLTKNEIFEYDTGEDFVNSPLVTEFLLPVWLDFLSEKEQKQVTKKLAQIIDEERDGITFRFSVKATFVSGEKAK